MSHRLLPAFAFPALALLAAADPPPARAQTLLDNPPPAVRQVMNQLRQTCVARGRTPIFSPDFLFSTDADGDGAADDIFLTEAGFSCLTRAQLNGAEGGHGGNGMQWLLVKGRGPLRLVWHGRSPSLSAADDTGLFNAGVQCRMAGCNKMIWNGRALVPAPRRR